MTKTPDRFHDLDVLLAAICDDAVHPEQIARLESLAGDTEGLFYVLEYLQLDGLLRWENGSGNVECQQSNEQFNADGDFLIPVQEAFVSPACCPPSADRPSSPPCPIRSESSSATPSFLSTALPSTIGYLSSGWPVAYLIATVIFGIGLLISAHVYVSQPLQVANQSVSLPSPLFPLPSVVGRITGMVDCKWVTKGLGIRDWGLEISDLGFGISANPQSLVSLGDRFALRSGLVEIAYDTGARVILQGPVTYEIESATGGFLSLGKLTARLERKAASGHSVSSPQPLAPSPSSNPQSPIPNPSFAVRTPTATVTDLGTEFGVEVDRQGTTQIHVLRGAVEAQIVGRRGETARHERVTEGRAIEIGQKDKAFTTVAFAPRSFVRTIRQTPADSPAEAAYMKMVLADKPLGYWPLNEPAGARKFLDRSGNGFHGYAMNRVNAGQTGPLSGKSRAVGLDASGWVDVGRHDEFALLNDFTLEAWVCIGGISSQAAARVIAATPGSVPIIGRGRQHGWSLEVSRQAAPKGVLPPVELRLTTYGVKDYELPLPSEMASQDRWIHVAVVCDRDNTAHFYLNGKHRESIAADKPANPGPVWIEVGGGTIRSDEFWNGRLAHLAVYPHALNAQQIENHYNQSRAP